MPSPTWSTVPTSARSVSTAYASIRCLRMEVISSGLSFKAAPSALASRDELAAEAVEPAADGGIDAERARLQHEAADQGGVDGASRLDRPARRLRDLVDDPAGLLVGQLVGRGQRHRQLPLLARDELLDLALHLLHLADPVLLGEQAQEVADELVGVLEDRVEHRRLRGGIELRVAQHRAQLRHGAHLRDEVAELAAHGVDSTRLAGGVVQRSGVDPVDDRHATARPYARSRSSTEKSSPSIASSIRRRWSAWSSTFPVTLAVASSVRSATSERISSSARLVSASISRRASSRRRVRSASSSSRSRSRCESATRRASVRIDSASLRARATRAWCSSSSLCASARARSASSSDSRMRSRRSSIAFWIGPKA